jgi:hypothetical protein
MTRLCTSTVSSSSSGRHLLSDALREFGDELGDVRLAGRPRDLM